MSNIVVRFIQAIEDILQDAQLAVKVSEPFREDGVWIVDFCCSDYALVVQYKADVGFGLSANPTDFSSNPDERFFDFKEAAHRAIDLIRVQGLTLPRLNNADRA